MNAVLKLVAVLTLAGIVGAQAKDPELDAGLRLLEEGRTTLADKPLSDARAHFLRLTQANPGDAIYWYELARVDHYRGEAVDMHGDKKAAIAAIESAIDEVQHAIKLNDSSADAHSLLADLYGRRIGLGGFMLGARLGPQIVAENKRAMELDGNNPRVFASLGRQYLMAPKMFGGDVDKAIANFQESVAIDPTNDETFVWLAIAERKKGDQPAANRAFDEALRLNPRSVFAAQEKNKKER